MADPKVSASHAPVQAHGTLEPDSGPSSPPSFEPLVLCDHDESELMGLSGYPICKASGYDPYFRRPSSGADELALVFTDCPTDAEKKEARRYAQLFAESPNLYRALAQICALFTPEIIEEFDRFGVLNSIILGTALTDAHAALKAARGEVQQ